jgi:hypothetical protein
MNETATNIADCLKELIEAARIVRSRTFAGRSPQPEQKGVAISVLQVAQIHGFVIIKVSTSPIQLSA